MLTDDWMRRRWLEACDCTAIPLGAFKAIARVIEAEIAAKTGKSPVARVREHGDFQATVDWLLNPLPDGTELFDDPVDCPKCDEWRASEHNLSEAYLRIRQKLNTFDTPHGPTADQVYEHTEAAIDAMQAKVAILDGLSQDAIDGGWTYRGMNAYAVGLEAKIAELEEALRPKPLREGLVPHAFMLEPTHNNAEFWQRGGHNEPDRFKALMCVDQAVNAWKNAAYARAEEVMVLKATVAELDEVNEHHRELARVSRDAELNAVRVAAEQEALIEKCERALAGVKQQSMTSYGENNENYIEDEFGELCYIVPHEPMLEIDESIAAIASHRSASTSEGKP